MLDREFFASYRVLPSPPWEAAVVGAFRAMERATRTRVVTRGFERPRAPVIFASNSTQKYDFMPMRAEAMRMKMPLVTVTKAKNYHSSMRVILDRTGVVPIASKGYVLVIDFTAVHGRRPDEGEYRAMRDHLDAAAPLPEGPIFRALQRQPRAILGHPFDPARQPWREALRGVYRGMMAETVRLAGEAARAGHHIHMYPEGTVSPRLGQGRAGVIQLAHALKLPIVPFGMNGCAGAFRGQSVALRGGTIELSFGEAYRPDLSALPLDFRPFDPDDERQHGGALRAATDELMARIEAQLWPSLRRSDGPEAPGGSRGTRRFL